MSKRVVSKETIDVIVWLGVPYMKSVKEIGGLHKAAEQTLINYSKGRWNTANQRFIEDNYHDIEAISNGEPVKYKTATIYRDAETKVLEIEEE